MPYVLNFGSECILHEKEASVQIMARLAWTDGEVTDQQLNTEHIKTMFQQSLFPPKDNVNQTHLKLLMDIFTTFLKQVENMQASQSNKSSVETLKLFTNFISHFISDKILLFNLSTSQHSFWD